jgi:hypothetical protein
MRRWRHRILPSSRYVCCGGVATKIPPDSALFTEFYEALFGGVAQWKVGVVLAPQRARSLVSFLDKWKFSVVDQRRPKLHMFEHFHGARVYDGLFPDYQLPNGRKAFFCYESKLLDEVEVTLRECPEVPSTLSMALQVCIRSLTYYGEG